MRPVRRSDDGSLSHFRSPSAEKEPAPRAAYAPGRKHFNVYSIVLLLLCEVDARPSAGRLRTLPTRPPPVALDDLRAARAARSRRRPGCRRDSRRGGRAGRLRSDARRRTRMPLRPDRVSAGMPVVPRARHAHASAGAGSCGDGHPSPLGHAAVVASRQRRRSAEESGRRRPVPPSAARLTGARDVRRAPRLLPGRRHACCRSAAKTGPSVVGH